MAETDPKLKCDALVNGCTIEDRYHAICSLYRLHVSLEHTTRCYLRSDPILRAGFTTF